MGENKKLRKQSDSLNRRINEAATAEAMMQEVLGSARAFEKFFRRLKRKDPGTEVYFNLLSELWAEAEVLKTKAEHSKEVTDQLMDALSD